ncbi:MAG: SDR family oxidoreductase [Gammaproteobacteria bacterium]|nr:SDR family oxidoreductase [Gammaproteobacteria bacterium]
MNKNTEMNPELSKLVAAAQDGEVHLVALVRDPQGRPKFDDPNNVPQAILDVLTEDDLRYLETLKSEAL